MVMCCGNASRNHKLKVVVIGKARKLQPFKGTKANCISVHYYNQKGAWMEWEIFENWLHKHLVPEDRAFLKQTGLPHKAVLLLGNAPSHPRVSILDSDDGLIIVKFLPPNVTAIIKSMDQEVIVSMRQCYWADLHGTLADEDKNIIALRKKNECWMLCTLCLRHGLP
jgi:hypothetical protein